jgi:serine/threonine protein kinase
VTQWGTHDGRLVGGRYLVEALLGRGSMGAVYRARHTLTGRAVALKIITHGAALSDLAGARFRREVGVRAFVGHEGIVEVLDAGAEPDGTLYLAMELLEGETFQDRSERPEFTPAHGLAVVRALLEPLAAAHAKGVIHRDLKPENVFLHHPPSGAEVVKLLDFGIARDPRQQSATRTDVGLGTPYYMAPEQATNARDVTPASDVWSVGVMLYAVLAGRLPFAEDTPFNTLAAACARPHPPLRRPEGATWAPGLIPLVDRCLSKEPSLRPADGGALARALDALGGPRQAGLPTLETIRVPRPGSSTQVDLRRVDDGPLGRLQGAEPDPGADAARSTLADLQLGVEASASQEVLQLEAAGEAPAPRVDLYARAPWPGSLPPSPDPTRPPDAPQARHPGPALSAPARRPGAPEAHHPGPALSAPAGRPEAPEPRHHGPALGTSAPAQARPRGPRDARGASLDPRATAREARMVSLAVPLPVPPRRAPPRWALAAAALLLGLAGAVGWQLEAGPRAEAPPGAPGAGAEPSASADRSVGTGGAAGAGGTPDGAGGAGGTSGAGGTATAPAAESASGVSANPGLEGAEGLVAVPARPGVGPGAPAAVPGTLTGDAAAARSRLSERRAEGPEASEGPMGPARGGPAGYSSERRAEGPEASEGPRGPTRGGPSGSSSADPPPAASPTPAGPAPAGARGGPVPPPDPRSRPGSAPRSPSPPPAEARDAGPAPRDSAPAPGAPEGGGPDASGPATPADAGQPAAPDAGAERAPLPPDAGQPAPPAPFLTF